MKRLLNVGGGNKGIPLHRLIRDGSTFSWTSIPGAAGRHFAHPRADDSTARAIRRRLLQPQSRALLSPRCFPGCSRGSATCSRRTDSPRSSRSGRLDADRRPPWAGCRRPPLPIAGWADHRSRRALRAGHRNRAQRKRVGRRNRLHEEIVDGDAHSLAASQSSTTGLATSRSRRSHSKGPPPRRSGCS